MTDRFCTGCPARSTNKAQEHYCHLLPELVFIPNPDTHFCYLGRQLMEEEASLQHARDPFGGTYTTMTVILEGLD